MKSKDAEQALHELQELQELRDYLRFKIECRVTYYEAQVSKVDDNYLAEVAKLAGKGTPSPQDIMSSKRHGQISSSPSCGTSGICWLPTN